MSWFRKPPDLNAPYLDDIRDARTDETLIEETRKIPCIAVIGPAGVGKTTTINQLFGTNLPTSHVTRGTFEPTIEKVETPKGPIAVIDMPGLGETIEVHQRYLNTHYLEYLPKADAVLWVMEPTRHLEPDQRYLSELRSIIPTDVFSKIIFCINKVDTVQPGEWIKGVNLPDKQMRRSIAGYLSQASSVFGIPEEHIVPYAALRGYNLDLLRLRMLEVVPSRRRILLDSRTSPASPLEEMSKEYRKQYKETLKIVEGLE